MPLYPGTQMAAPDYVAVYRYIIETATEVPCVNRVHTAASMFVKLKYISKEDDQVLFIFTFLMQPSATW